MRARPWAPWQQRGEFTEPSADHRGFHRHAARACSVTGDSASMALAATRSIQLRRLCCSLHVGVLVPACSWPCCAGAGTAVGGSPVLLLWFLAPLPGCPCCSCLQGRGIRLSGICGMISHCPGGKVELLGGGSHRLLEPPLEGPVIVVLQSGLGLRVAYFASARHSKIYPVPGRPGALLLRYRHGWRQRPSLEATISRAYAPAALRAETERILYVN